MPDADRVRLAPPLPRWLRWFRRGGRFVLDTLDAIDFGEAVVGLFRLLAEHLH
jgi:hypothetical protein